MAGCSARGIELSGSGVIWAQAVQRGRGADDSVVRIALGRRRSDTRAAAGRQRIEAAVLVVCPSSGGTARCSTHVRLRGLQRQEKADRLRSFAMTDPVANEPPSISKTVAPPGASTGWALAAPGQPSIHGLSREPDGATQVELAHRPACQAVLGGDASRLRR